ncbi:MAG: hypothetical protein NVS3B12_04110 [Acidimicrobiales bacterium]
MTPQPSGVTSDHALIQLPDGVVAVVKRDCPTCVLVGPLLASLAGHGAVIAVASQDDAGFPSGVAVIDDTDLELSWALEIETVPTLVRIADGRVGSRLEGWSREQWASFFGSSFDASGDIAARLPDWRPGCGSLTQDPVRAAELRVRHGGAAMRSRRIEIGGQEDDIEAMFDRGWSDGLPVVPPTESRVLAMLDGTDRDPSEVVATVPPDLEECTVEKVAVNAVLAGCRPEYLPVVLAAVEAACTDEFNMHGLLATTYFSGPLVIVNGPVAQAIGMNSGVNVLGQGNRANATIGRALQLVVRNVGGGRPGGVDRAALGNPGKLGWCFAEDEGGSPWESLGESRGLPPGGSGVTLFAAAGVTPVVDQSSRTPHSLSRSFAAVLRTVAHPKLVIGFDALLVVCPEHARVFRDAGWDRARLMAELGELLTIPGDELVKGFGGIDEGLPDWAAGRSLPKFREGGLLVVHAGGGAGMFSAVIGGWASGSVGSEPVTHPVPWP